MEGRLADESAPLLFVVVEHPVGVVVHLVDLEGEVLAKLLSGFGLDQTQDVNAVALIRHISVLIHATHDEGL